jgi:hypothetical protein
LIAAQRHASADWSSLRVVRCVWRGLKKLVAGRARAELRQSFLLAERHGAAYRHVGEELLQRRGREPPGLTDERVSAGAVNDSPDRVVYLLVARPSRRCLRRSHTFTPRNTVLRIKPLRLSVSTLLPRRLRPPRPRRLAGCRTALGGSPLPGLPGLARDPTHVPRDCAWSSPPRHRREFSRDSSRAQSKGLLRLT